ncbi:hypothetical protein MIFL109517_00480 [Micrococcus flavus]
MGRGLAADDAVVGVLRLHPAGAAAYRTAGRARVRGAAGPGHVRPGAGVAAAGPGTGRPLGGARRTAGAGRVAVVRAPDARAADLLPGRVLLPPAGPAALPGPGPVPERRVPSVRLVHAGRRLAVGRVAVPVRAPVPALRRGHLARHRRPGRAVRHRVPAARARGAGPVCVGPAAPGRAGRPVRAVGGVGGGGQSAVPALHGGRRPQRRPDGGPAPGGARPHGPGPAPPGDGAVGDRAGGPVRGHQAADRAPAALRGPAPARRGGAVPAGRPADAAHPPAGAVDHHGDGGARRADGPRRALRAVVRVGARHDHERRRGLPVRPGRPRGPGPGLGGRRRLPAAGPAGGRLVLHGPDRRDPGVHRRAGPPAPRPRAAGRVRGGPRGGDPGGPDRPAVVSAVGAAPAGVRPAPAARPGRPPAVARVGDGGRRPGPGRGGRRGPALRGAVAAPVARPGGRRRRGTGRRSLDRARRPRDRRRVPSRPGRAPG